MLNTFKCFFPFLTLNATKRVYCKTENTNPNYSIIFIIIDIINTPMSYTINDCSKSIQTTFTHPAERLLRFYLSYILHGHPVGGFPCFPVMLQISSSGLDPPFIPNGYHKISLSEDRVIKWSTFLSEIVFSEGSKSVVS